MFSRRDVANEQPPSQWKGRICERNHPVPLQCHCSHIERVDEVKEELEGEEEREVLHSKPRLAISCKTKRIIWGVAAPFF